LKKLKAIAFVTFRENAEKRWGGRSGGPWRRIYECGMRIVEGEKVVKGGIG